jgi:hypothetical protein
MTVYQLYSDIQSFWVDRYVYMWIDVFSLSGNILIIQLATPGGATTRLIRRLKSNLFKLAETCYYIYIIRNEFTTMFCDGAQYSSVSELV